MAKTVVAIVILVVLLLFNPGLMHIGKLSVARKEIGEDVKIRPVFRYAVNLSLGDLRRQVKEELDASKYLIVICSPNSAQPNIEGKHWVNDEVTRFIETGKADYIIPVIVDGEPNVGGEKECFPPALRNSEIAGANLSKGGRSDRRNDFLKKEWKFYNHELNYQVELDCLKSLVADVRRRSVTPDRWADKSSNGLWRIEERKSRK